MDKEVVEGQNPHSLEDEIISLRNEIIQLHQQLDLLPDRMIKRLREELRMMSTGKLRVAGYSTVAEVATKIQRSPVRVR